MRRWRLVVALALVLGAAACGGGGDSTSSTTSSSSSTTSSSSSVSSTTAVTNASATTTTAPGVTTCQVANMAAAINPGSPGAGQRYATVVFTNNGQQACTMFGNIGLQLLGANNQPIPTKVVRDTAKPKKTAALVPGGGQAFTTLHWTAIPGAGEPTNGPCEPTPQQVRITPPNETHFFTQPWTLDAVCGQGAIDTGPVQPGNGS